MAANMSETYLIIGGSGFLGNHLVQSLLARGGHANQIAVFDLVQRFHHKGVQFISGDLTDESSVRSVMQRVRPTVIFHTASPIHGKPAQIYHSVNVQGTLLLLQQSREIGTVHSFVFTSSAGIVYNGNPLTAADERTPPLAVHMDAYNETKAIAEELVLRADGQGGMRTVALRPAGIFGPGDQQAVPSFIKVMQNKQSHYQIGANDNLFDWTYVGNVVHAHLLAADKLSALHSSSSSPEKGKPLGYLLAQSEIRRDRVPTSKCKPLGPVQVATPQDHAAARLWESGHLDGGASAPVQSRTRFDQFNGADLDAEAPVAGQAFFITNNAPLYFWDFPRALWACLGHTESKYTVIPKALGYWLASAAEIFGNLMGRPTLFTTGRVAYTSVDRWYNIEKARVVLGYEPITSVQDAIKITMDHYKAQNSEKSAS